MLPNDLVSKKGRYTIFSCLSSEELEELELVQTTQVYKKGQPVFQENTQSAALFYVNQGFVKVTKLGSNGKEQILRIAKTDDLVGYRSVISGSRYKSSAIAIEDSVITLIPKAFFLKLLQNNPVFYSKVTIMLCETLDRTETKITDIAYKPVRGRIAEALLLLNDLLDEKEHITLTREDLAGLVGTVKETAIRIISEFKHDKLIEIHKRSIKVVNEKGLEKVSSLYN
ncbi:Crp/Fnr family transcriptional regulator [Sediminitomix flava]|uniref:Crp/Fnr family transcriptional regulator n=1 Tax=Sediminitomix flava TaxID=379075 RepID=UPI001304F42E|nr:Crp/Fnr family transcriptional regulator [Sediminitomix flava]